MNKYEETGKYPKGQFSDHAETILKARNRGWTYRRIASYFKQSQGLNFNRSSLAGFCNKAFKVIERYSPAAYNPEDNVKWSVPGLQLLEATS